jgi:hypothetical protein
MSRTSTSDTLLFYLFKLKYIRKIVHRNIRYFKTVGVIYIIGLV